MSEFIQYIVVRKDLISIMGIGKTSAQVAHGSLGALLNDNKLYDDVSIQSWINGGFSKIIVYIKTKTKLINLSKKLDTLEIRVKLIYDACFTKLQPEEENGTTLTCMGVIPLNKEKVPKCLKKLRLLD